MAYLLVAYFSALKHPDSTVEQRLATKHSRNPIQGNKVYILAALCGCKLITVFDLIREPLNNSFAQNVLFIFIFV